MVEVNTTTNGNKQIIFLRGSKEKNVEAIVYLLATLADINGNKLEFLALCMKQY